ncbi:hypothetical protein BGW39_007646 [Mortierella sp. 14UC]|nr:hypothetical protein BGW39_007646 [Mortierella sp. 14UC]
MLTLAASRWARKPSAAAPAPSGATKTAPVAPSAPSKPAVTKPTPSISTPFTKAVATTTTTPIPTTLTASTSVVAASASHQPTVSVSVSVSNSQQHFSPPPPPGQTTLSSPTKVSPSPPLISKISVQAQPTLHSNNTKLPPSPILLVATTATTTPSTLITPPRLPAFSHKTLSPSAAPLFLTTDPEKIKAPPTPTKVKHTPVSLSLLSTWSDVETTSVEAFFGDTSDYNGSPSPEFSSATPPAIASSPIAKHIALPTVESIAEPILEPIVGAIPESTPALTPAETPRTSPDPVTVHSPNTLAAIAFISAANAASIRVSKETSNTSPDLKEFSAPPSPTQEQEQGPQHIPSPPQSPVTAPEPESIDKAPNPTMADPKTPNRGPITKIGVPAVNPYQAFVAAVDPDGTIPDGRVYVGTKSHHLDRPAPPRPSAQAPKHTFAFSQNQGRSQGGAGSPQSQGQNRSQAQAQSQTRPAQSQATYRAPPSMPPARNRPNAAPQSNYRGNQQSQLQSQAPRTLTDSRWSGKALATAAALPEGFFSTAKTGVTSPTPTPQARLQSTNSSQAPQQQKRQQAPASDQGYDTTAVQTAFTSLSVQDKPKPTSSPRIPQALSPQQHPYQQQQQQQQQRPQGPLARENGRNGSHMPPFSPYQGSATRSVRDEDFSDDDRMSVTTNRTARPRMSMPEEKPGDPRFFQYNVGDGCHMVVAMYMERDASTALARFPGLARVRNDSSSSVKSVEQVAEIFRSAVIEEKKNLTD